MSTKPLAWIAVLALTVAVLPRTSAQDAGQSALERDPQGWQNLMPDEKLTHWTRQPIPITGTLGRSQWHVDPATNYLVCDGDGGHDWLRFDHEYADFVYHVEFRFTPVEGKTGYNSGVFVRNGADGTIWHQAQVASASGGWLFGNSPANGEVKRFNLSREIKEQRVKPAGEWNTFEVTCRGKSISVWVNGAVQCEWPACEVPKGYVGLEGEGWKIEFRNVKLKELR